VAKSAHSRKPKKCLEEKVKAYPDGDGTLTTLEGRAVKEVVNSLHLAKV